MNRSWNFRRGVLLALAILLGEMGIVLSVSRQTTVEKE